MGGCAGVILNRASSSISFTLNGAHMGLAVTARDFGAGECVEEAQLVVKVQGISGFRYNFGQDPKMSYQRNMDDIMCDEEEKHTTGDPA